jgi:hypothetical protein
MFWKEDGETIKSHLVRFYDQYQFQKDQTPNLNIHEFAESYIKNEISMEAGMQEYFEGLDKVAKYNNRILRAIKSIKGKTFTRHLISLMNDAGIVNWDEWQIVSEPSGAKQKENEYGRSIKNIWVDQWSVGTEGDSFDGYIEVQLKENKYLKFRYSC